MNEAIAFLIVGIVITICRMLIAAEDLGWL